MMRFAFFLGFLTLAAGCIVEDKPITPPGDGGVDAGELCGTVTCPADQPVCIDELECVQCTADDDSYCTEQGLLCEVASSNCIACSGDADCTDPTKARCDNNVCVPCTEPGHCEGIEGIGDGESACAGGVCVDCTSELETSTCPDLRTCNPATNECTDVVVGSLEVCEECVADSQCGEDGQASAEHRCVPMYYEMMDNRFPNSDTGFCLKAFSSGGCEQPYAIETRERTSLSGNSLEDYCGINETLATCPAVRALDQNDRCPNGEDSSCPESGLCRDVGGLSVRCTYACENDVECLENIPEGRPGSKCDSSGAGGAGGAGGKYCGGG